MLIVAEAYLLMLWSRDSGVSGEFDAEVKNWPVSLLDVPKQSIGVASSIWTCYSLKSLMLGCRPFMCGETAAFEKYFSKYVARELLSRELVPALCEEDQSLLKRQ